MRSALLLAFIFALISRLSGAPEAEIGSYWLQRSQPVEFQHFESICTNGEVFVTMGRSPAINGVNFLSVSRDGKAWTLAKQTGNSFLTEVASGNGRFVAVGWRGEIQNSANGIKWQRATSPTTANLNAVQWTGSRWVAAGEAGTVLLSADGLTWTALSTGLGTAVNWTGVSVLDTCSLIFGGGIILRSTDGGVTWSQVTGAPGMDFTCAAQTAVGIMLWSQGGACRLWDGGTSWTLPHSYLKSGILYGTVLKIRSHNGHHLAFTNRGEIAASADGLEWLKLTIPIQDPIGGAVADAVPTANGWLIVRRDGQVFEATPGATWSPTNSNTMGINSLHAVIRHRGEFLAMGGYGTRYRSADGITWESVFSSGGTWLRRAAVSRGDTLVIVGKGAQITVERPSSTNHVPVPPNTDLFGIAASPSAFVAVGRSGTILRSPDGIEWTQASSGTTELLTAIVWDGSHFHAVGKNGIHLHSADGLAWQQQSTPGQHHLSAIAVTSRGLIAVGHRGAILVSQNGFSWIDRSLDVPDDFQTIVETDRGLFALGKHLASAWSPDAVQWKSGPMIDSGNTDVSSAIFHEGTLIAACGMSYDFESDQSTSGYGTVLVSRFPYSLGFLANPKPQFGAITARADGRFIAAGDSAIWSSADGARWDKQSMTNWRFQDAETAGETTVLAGTGGLLWSTDGTQWEFAKASTSDGAVTGGAYSSLYGVVHGNGRWVAAGRSGLILISDDGRTWRSPSNYPNVPWHDYYRIAYGNDRFVVLGGNNTVRVSTDGETWTTPTLPSSGSFSDVFWSGLEFRIANGNSVLVSTDGVNWTSRSATNGGLGRHVTIDGRTYLAGSGERIDSTTDQVNWTRHSSDVIGSTSHAVRDRQILDLAKSGGTFVAVGTDGLVMSSEDGLQWTYRNGGMVGNPHSVHWIKDRFFVTSVYGGLFSSPDGGTWTKHRTGVTYNPLYTMGWNGTRAVAMGTGLALHSTDLWNWTPATIPADAEVTALAWAGDRYMAVAKNYKAGISFDGVTWTFGPAPINYAERIAWNGTRALCGPYRTTDGVTWERFYQDWAEVDAIWDGSKFIYSGGTFIGISPDGLSGYRVLDGPINLRKAIHTDHGYLGLVYDMPTYRLYRSGDGIHWADSGERLPSSIRGFAWSGRQLMAAGEGGEIYTTSLVDSPFFLAAAANQGDSTENDLSLEGDANSDGIGNAVAHYFGLPLDSPWSPADRVRLPHLIGSGSGERRLEFLLPESDAPFFLDLVIEQSGDLHLWSECAVRAPSGAWSDPAVGEEFSSGFRKVTLPIEAGDEAGFWRIKVRERP